MLNLHERSLLAGHATGYYYTYLYLLHLKGNIKYMKRVYSRMTENMLKKEKQT